MSEKLCRGIPLAPDLNPSLDPESVWKIEPVTLELEKGVGEGEPLVVAAFPQCQANRPSPAGYHTGRKHLPVPNGLLCKEEVYNHLPSL